MDNAPNDVDEFKHLIKNILDTQIDRIVYEYLENKNDIDRLQILSAHIYPKRSHRMGNAPSYIISSS